MRPRATIICGPDTIVEARYARSQTACAEDIYPALDACPKTVVKYAIQAGAEGINTLDFAVGPQ